MRAWQAMMLCSSERHKPAANGEISATCDVAVASVARCACGTGMRAIAAAHPRSMRRSAGGATTTSRLCRRYDKNAVLAALLAAAAYPEAWPQPGQNRAPAASWPPQPVQNTFAAVAVPTGLPQPAQNLAPGATPA